jgi:glycosyltransferase involved in cell wall biosynthesis
VKRRRIALVVQRYGAEITGGSESLARAVAERLQASMDVTVFTTCATDYVTWRNVVPAGEEVRNGVRILRFPVAEERDLTAFNRYAEGLYAGGAGPAQEQEWLRRQGPYVPSLIEALRERKDAFDAFLFFTYLYYPTVEGLKVCPERSVLVPTAHDEPPLRFTIYDEAFSKPRGFVFCSAPEEALVRARFSVSGVPSAVAGIGIEVGAGSRSRPEGEPYVLYAGRIDAGKGCLDMLSWYRAFRARRPGGPRLDLIGTLAMDLPRDASVRYRGYLSEQEKMDLMASAQVVLCPSPFESLSITLLEGFACGTPALANARSPVLKDHCLRSNGGLFYDGEGEFVEALDRLWSEPELRRALGENGLDYVRREYTWERVLGKYTEVIGAVCPT